MTDDPLVHAPQPVLPSVEAVIKKLERAHRELCDAVQRQWDGGHAFKLSIPARPDEDSDLVIGEAIHNAISVLRAQEETPERKWCPQCQRPADSICVVYKHPVEETPSPSQEQSGSVEPSVAELRRRVIASHGQRTHVDALIAAVRAEEKKTLTRFDQPQLRACASDLRGDDRGRS